MTFKDPCNLRSPQQHAGVVHSSNLCTEITLNTNADEIAVCNLGSVNLPQHVGETAARHVAKLAEDRTHRRCACSTTSSTSTTTRCRRRATPTCAPPRRPGPDGLPGRAVQAAHAYASDEAVTFADRSMEAISYFAIEASATWPRSAAPTRASRARCGARASCPSTRSTCSSESAGKDYMRGGPGMHHGLGHPARRCGPTACATPTSWPSHPRRPSPTSPAYPSPSSRPTRTSTSNRTCPASSPWSIPTWSGPQGRGLWDKVMVNDLKYYDGSVQAIDRIPDDLKAIYATAFEVEPRWLVEAASRRQKWIDQAQSLNLYINERERQEARHHLSHGLVQRPQDHLLPALAGGHGHGEVDRRHGHAECGVQWSRLSPGSGACRPARWTTRIARPASIGLERGSRHRI
jgi:ribonucleoside-diphosphate reductase alpha chain